MIRLALIALFVVGCGKKKDEPAPAPATPPPVTAPADAAAAGSAAGSHAAAGSNAATAGSAAAKVDVPTATDFEDKASKDITDKNVEAKVKEMEGELGQ